MTTTLIALATRRALLPPRAIEFTLLLAGYFLYSIRWGEENEQFLLRLGWLQLLVTLWALMRYKVTRHGLGVIAVVFTGLVCMQLVYPGIIEKAQVPGDEDLYTTAALRLYIYLLFICLHALTMRPADSQTFIDCLLWLSRTSVIIAVTCMILYWFTEIRVLMNIYPAQGIARPQAFLSEPSAFAPLVGCLLIFGWQRKKLMDIVLGITALAIALSPITIIAGLGAFFAYALLLGTRSIAAKASVIAILAATLVSLASMNCHERVISNNTAERTIGRVSCGIQVLYDRELKTSLAGIFNNDRLESTLKSIEFLEDRDAMRTGMGLNSSSIFMPILYGETRENSFWLSVLLFYGVYGVIIQAALCLAAMIRLSQVHQGMAAVLIVFLASSTINSAGGFYLYSLLLWTMCYALSSACEGPCPYKKTDPQDRFRAC